MPVEDDGQGRWRRRTWATERNSTSTAGRQEFSGGSWLQPEPRLRSIAHDDHVIVARRDPGLPRLQHGRRRSFLTRNGELAASRSARSRVNMGGMCCTMTIGTGKSLGSLAKTSARAFGPPVEAPMARTCERPLASPAAPLRRLRSCRTVASPGPTGSCAFAGSAQGLDLRE